MSANFGYITDSEIINSKINKNRNLFCQKNPFGEIDCLETKRVGLSKMITTTSGITLLVIFIFVILFSFKFELIILSGIVINYQSIQFILVMVVVVAQIFMFILIINSNKKHKKLRI